MSMNAQLRRHFASAFAAALLLGGCSGSVEGPGSTGALDGPWSTHTTLGFGLVLTLSWTADSVTGTGSYSSIAGNGLRCGGETLSGTGTVRLAAARTSAASIAGYMSFDNGWMPPYSGTLTDSSHIAGEFHSVDQGPCTLDLFRGLVP